MRTLIVLQFAVIAHFTAAASEIFISLSIATRQCRQRRYFFRPSVHRVGPFVLSFFRINIVTTTSDDALHITVIKLT